MSEVVTEPTAAPAVAPAPASEPAPSPAPEPIAAPEPTPAPKPEPARPMNRREARRGLHQDRAAKIEAAPAPEPEKPAEPVVETPVAATEPAPSAPTPEGAAAPEAAPVVPPAEPAKPEPPKILTVPIPDKHPLAEMGVKELPARDEREARAIRAMLNSHVRRQEVVERDKRIAELQEWKIRREAEEAARGQWEQTPEAQAIKQQYDDIKNTYGEAAAKRYLEGASKEMKSLVDQEYDKRMQTVNAEREAQMTQQHAQAAEQFATQAWERAQRLEKLRGLPEFGQYFDDAIRDFDALVAAGRAKYANGQLVERGDFDGLQDAFTRFFSERLITKPAIVAALRAADDQEKKTQQAAADAAAAKQREIDAIRKQAVEDHLRGLAEKRQAAPPNPLANLGPAATRDRPPTPDADTTDGLDKLGPTQLKRQLRQQSREDARQRFAQR